MTLKTLPYILIASALLAGSCTKLEIDDKRGESPIAFNPVGRMMTKAILEGSTFPTGQSFVVGGYYETSAVYFEGLTASSTTVNGSTRWGTSPVMYWPLAGRLDFICYSPDDVATNTGATITVSPSSGISATGYVNDGDTDFMYAQTTVADCAAHPDYVSLVFSHALSQVVIKVKQEANYTAEINGYTNIVRLTVNDLTLSGIYNSGSFAQQGTPQWTMAGNSANLSLLSSDTPLVYGNDPQMVARTLLLPQDLTNAVITGNYTIQQTITLNGDTQGTTTVTKSYKIPFSLNLAGYTASWSPGYKYIYTLSFSMETIQITARTSDWLPGGDEITIEED